MIWDRVGPDNTRATEFILPSFQAPYTGPGGITVSGGTGGETDSGGFWPSWPHDISSAVRGMGMFSYNMGPYLNPPVPSDMRSFLLAAVDHLGLVAWDVTKQTRLGPTPVGIGPFMKAPASPWLEHKAAAPGWADPDDAAASGDLTGGNGFWAPARTPATPLASFLTGGPAPPENPVYHVAPVPTGAMRVQVYPGYNCLDACGEEYQTTIALVAGGQAGVLVYEVYPEYAVYPQGNDPARDPDDTGLTPATKPFMELRAIIPVSWTNGRDPGDTHAGNAYDVVLDTRRRLAYVADFSDSVVVLDMKEPFRAPAALLDSGYCRGPISGLVGRFFTEHPPYECISRLDKDGDGKDDRIAGTIPLCPDPQHQNCASSRSTLILDSDTGLLYVGASGPIDTDPTTSGGGLKTVGANEPRMEFLLDDTAHPGQLKAPGYLSAFDGDKPRLGMWVQGGVGAVNAFTGRGEISADIALIDRLGFRETEQVIGQNLDGSEILAPSSTVARQVTLTRQSLKKTDPKYNFFLQEWNAPGTQVPDPNQKVQLAMMYSQTDPNTPADPAFTPAWLMTSKQSGSIRGIVFMGSANTVPAYLRNRTMTKETKVARPWIGTTDDEWLDPVQNTTVSAGGTGSTAAGVVMAVDYGGSQYFAIGQPRYITFDFWDMYLDVAQEALLYPAQLYLAQRTPSEAVVTALTQAVAPDQIRLIHRWSPGLKIEVIGLSATDLAQGSNNLILSVRYRNGSTKTIGKIPYYVFNAGMAVDYNRDGEIHFGDSDDPDTSDMISSGEFFRFWLNENMDDFVEADGPNNEEQDDIHSRSDSTRFPGNAPPNWVTSNNWKDCEDKVISLERDLEDFARMHLKMAPPGLPVSLLRSLKYKLYFEAQPNWQPGDYPQINIFRAVRGNESYLKDVNAAHDQINSPLRDPWVGQASYNTGRSSHITLPRNPTPIPPLNSTNLSGFLFEGVHEGMDNLVYEIRLPNPADPGNDNRDILIGRYKLPLALQPITDFYEQYSVGDGNADQPNSVCPMGDCPMPGAPFRYPSMTAQTSDEEKDYVLFVHGFNWEGWQKSRYAETMFKRLYWLGYKGRIGLFHWPASFGTFNGPLYFPTSEFRAFQSGEALRNLIRNLIDQRQYRVHLHAHSQGNMVAGEALRQLANQGRVNYVNTYIAAQAALPANMYTHISNVVPLDPRSADVTRTRPDLYGKFPVDGLPPPDHRPYFENVKGVCKYMANFFNEYDNAVGAPVDRRNANTLPADHGRTVGWIRFCFGCGSGDYYGGWFLFNQCIKPEKVWAPFGYGFNYGRIWSVPFYYKNFNQITGLLSGDQYLHNGSEYQLLTYPNLVDPAHPILPPWDDRYQAMAFGTQTYSTALGATRGMTHDSQGRPLFDIEHDLQALGLFNLPYPEEAVLLIYHGGQYRSYLANTAHSRRTFWYQFLSDMQQGGANVSPRH